MKMLRRLMLSLLRRSSRLYAAARAAHQQHEFSRAPVQMALGFKFAGPKVMEAGEFEVAETAQVSALLRETSVFVNIGANCGYYACLARSAGATVVAIEPLDFNVQMLQRNVLVNGWDDVEVLPVGLGVGPSLMKLYGGGTAASFVPGWANASHEHFRMVPVTTLDAVLADRFTGEKLLIVMDVEGFELSVLKGAMRQLKRRPAPVWFVEICINEHQPAGVAINPELIGTFELFWDHGYVAEKAGCESGLVTQRAVLAWSQGEDLPKTHNFLFRQS